MLSVIGQINRSLATLEELVHESETSLFFLAGIWLSFTLFNNLTETVNWCLIDVLDFVYCDNRCHRPVQAERVRLISCQHVELDRFVAFKLKSVGSGDFASWSDLTDHLLHALQSVDRTTEVEWIVPVQL